MQGSDEPQEQRLRPLDYSPAEKDQFDEALNGCLRSMLIVFFAVVLPAAVVLGLVLVFIRFYRR